MCAQGSSIADPISHDLVLANVWDRAPGLCSKGVSICTSEVLPHSKEVVSDLLAASDLLPA